jgi:hypothetical protein
VRTALVLTSTMAVGAALLSCSAPQSSTALSPATAVSQRSEPIVRAPLAPPVGYASPPVTARAASASYANSYRGGVGVWHVSPNWTAVEGDGCIVVEEKPHDESSLQSGAAKFKVKKCSKEDADPKPHPAGQISGH